jgi:CheY-like chemotaxis protein
VFESDLNQSLTTAKSTAPILIISELAAPNIDGLELCRRAQRDKSLSAIPIVLVGELPNSSSIVTDALRCGAVEYYQKPIDQIELFEIYRRFADLDDHDPAAAQRESRIMSTIVNISDEMTFVDSDGTILFVGQSTNPEPCYLHNEHIGTSIFYPTYPDDVDGVSDHFA